MPNLANWCFDKHAPILILFGREHWHTSKMMRRFNFPLSIHFYLLYLPLNSNNRNDAMLTWGSVQERMLQDTRRAAPHWHMGKRITKHHRQGCWSMEKVVTCMVGLAQHLLQGDMHKLTDQIILTNSTSRCWSVSTVNSDQ